MRDDQIASRGSSAASNPSASSAPSASSNSSAPSATRNCGAGGGGADTGQVYRAGSGTGLSQATVPILLCVTTRATRLVLTSNLSSLARLEVKFYPCAEHYLLEGTPSKEK